MTAGSSKRLPGIQALVSLGLFSLILFVSAGFALAWPEMAPDQFRLAVSLIIPATIAFIAPVFTAMTYKPYDIFHPLNFVGLSIFFGVFGRVLFLMTSQNQVAQDLLEGYPIEAIVPGAVLSAIGSVLICVGYSVTGTLSLRMVMLSRLFKKFSSPRFMIMLPLFFVACLIATALFLQATGFQYSGLASLSTKRRVLINGVESSLGYHRLIAQDLSRVILLVLIAIFLSSKRRSVWLFVGIAAFSTLAIALPFLASSRANVLLTLIAMCVVVNRIRGLSLTNLVASGIVSVVILTGMLALRRENNRGITASDTVFDLGMEPLFGNKNFACVVKLGHVYQSVPGVMAYKYGSSYLTILYSPIPRTVWEDKPSILMGREITEKLYNRGLDLRDKGGGTPPGMLAEAIINFGVIGFPFVVLLFGCLLRVLYNTLDHLAEVSVAGVALYGAVIPGFTLQLMSGEFSTAAIKLGTALILVIAVSLAARVKLLV